MGWEVQLKLNGRKEVSQSLGELAICKLIFGNRIVQHIGCWQIALSNSDPESTVGAPAWSGKGEVESKRYQACTC